MIMKQPYLKIMLLFLLCAFLTTQGASAHIHLADQHDHNGDSHQHSAHGHSHQLSNHHDNLIDAAVPTAEHRVVELDHECSAHGWNKLDDHNELLCPPSYPHNVAALSQNSDVIDPQPSPSPWLNYSTVRTRAPPSKIS